MLCTFAQVPIALHYLGAEGYGLWIVLMTAFGIFNTIDFGLGAGIQLRMAEAFAQHDGPRLRQTFNTGAVALALLAVGWAVIGLPLAWLGNWADWFHLSDPTLRGESSLAVAIIVVAAAAGLPGNAVAKMAAAVQLNWWHSLWNMVGNAATLAAVWLAARMDWGFLQFVAVGALLPTVQNLGVWWLLGRQLGWKGPSPGLLSREETRRILKTSAWLSLPQTAFAALGWLPSLTISIGAGAQAVTAFNLLQRLTSPVVHGQLVLLAPIWPVFAEAHVRGDVAWLRQARDKALLATCGGVAVVALICWQVPLLLSLWLGPNVEAPPPALIWASGAWCGLQLIGSFLNYYLMGVNRLRPLALFSTLGFVGSGVGLFVGASWGDAAWALALGSLAYGVLAIPGLARASMSTTRPHL